MIISRFLTYLDFTKVNLNKLIQKDLFRSRLDKIDRQTDRQTDNHLVYFGNDQTFSGMI